MYQWYDEPSQLLWGIGLADVGAQQSDVVWCGDSGTTNARAIVGAVDGVISMLQTVDSPDVNVICSCNNLHTLPYS